MFAVRLFRYRSQMTSKCGKTKEVAGECVTDAFTTLWRPLWSITEQTHGNMESTCFIQWSEKKKTDIYTCLAPLDCSTICASLGIFKSQTLNFIFASFFVFIDLYTVSSKSLSTPFLAQSRITTKIFLQNSESRSDDTRWQLLWRFLVVLAFSGCQGLFLSLFFHFSSF